ncbi:MAG: hypothetical protein L6R28_01725 [Planctomycetes bacterium]|nr:hypothetical protein [Planctomycetota bacterium]
MKWPMPESPTQRDFPHLVTHSAPKDDPYDAPAGDAPEAAFENSGGQIVSLSWQNRGVKRSRFPMAVAPYENPTLQRFREKYDFLDAIKGIGDEWQRLLALRNWVHRKLPSNNSSGEQNSFFKRPYPDESFDPFKVLDKGGSGCCWWCPHYSQMLRAVLTACGYVSRHVGNISPYSPKEGSRTHGVTDCFVQKYGKWVQFDANYDCHYERDGVPLSPFEIGEEWARNGGKDVTVHVGLENKTVGNALTPFEGENETCRAYWNQHRWYTDPFSGHGTWFGTWNSQMVLTLVGKRHEGILAYRGRAPESEVDAGYADGRIQYTTRAADVYPDIGTSHLSLEKGPHTGTVKVNVGTFTPNLDTVEVAVDDRMWSDQEPDFLWYLHEKKNVLRVRTRDKFGNLGRESSVNVELRAKA